MSPNHIGLTDRQVLIAHFTCGQLFAIATEDEGDEMVAEVLEFGVTPKDAIRVLIQRTKDVNGKRSRVRLAEATLRKIKATQSA